MKYITEENLLTIRFEAFQRCLIKHDSDTQFTSYKTIVFLHDWRDEINNLMLDPLYNKALNEETFYYFKHPSLWHNDLNTDDANDIIIFPISKFNLARSLCEEGYINFTVFKVVQLQFDSRHAYNLSRIAVQFEKEKEKEKEKEEYSSSPKILICDLNKFTEFLSYFVKHYDFKTNPFTGFGLCSMIKVLYDLDIMCCELFICLNNLLQFGIQIYEPDCFWFQTNKEGWNKRLILFDDLVKSYKNYLNKTNYHQVISLEEQNKNIEFYRNIRQ